MTRSSSDQLSEFQASKVATRGFNAFSLSMQYSNVQIGVGQMCTKVIMTLSTFKKKKRPEQAFQAAQITFPHREFWKKCSHFRQLSSIVLNGLTSCRNWRWEISASCILSKHGFRSDFMAPNCKKHFLGEHAPSYIPNLCTRGCFYGPEQWRI